MAPVGLVYKGNNGKAGKRSRQQVSVNAHTPCREVHSLRHLLLMDSIKGCHVSLHTFLCTHDCPHGCMAAQ